MSAPRSVIDISMKEKEFVKALESFEKMHDAITPRWLKDTQARNARPMVAAMKANNKSATVEPNIGVTTSKKKAGDLGIKVGVVKDSGGKEKFSVPALASAIEYGTAERYRQLKAAGFIIGRQSTGSMPEVPFLRKAWDANVKSLMDKTEESILTKIEKEV